MTAGRLQGKGAVITGGAGGIGKIAAKRFLDEGARVMLVDTDADGLATACDELGSTNAFSFVADVSQESEVSAYAQAAAAALGQIDVFLNNAGIEGEVANITEYSTETFDQVMSINVRGAWLGMKHVMPHMKASGGSIVITSSVAGYAASPRLSAYSISKHAVVGLMRNAAVEGAPDNIRVNSVHPGPIHTRMMHAIEEMASPGSPQAKRSDRERSIPLGRYGTPEEVADMMVFLGSDESSFCSGACYHLDGGQSAL